MFNIVTNDEVCRKIQAAIGEHDDNVKEWIGMDFASSTRAAENRTRWKGIVVKFKDRIKCAIRGAIL